MFSLLILLFIIKCWVIAQRYSAHHGSVKIETHWLTGFAQQHRKVNIIPQRRCLFLGQAFLREPDTIALLVKANKSDQRSCPSIQILSMQVKRFMGNSCLFIFCTKRLMLMHSTGNVSFSVCLQPWFIQTQISMHCEHTVECFKSKRLVQVSMDTYVAYYLMWSVLHSSWWPWQKQALW